jgi:molybdate transport system substrate-binding protein
MVGRDLVRRDLGKTLRVFGGGAVQGLVAAIAPSFEAEHGCRIDGEFSAVGAMLERVVAGEVVDVVVLTRPLIDELTRQRHLLAGTARDVGLVLTGLAVRTGDPVPAIGDAAALTTVLSAMDAVYMADPVRATAGIHFAKVVGELGLAQVIAPRMHAFPTGTVAMRELAHAQGGRRIGCTQITEILATPGLSLVGPLPKQFELATVYTAAVAAHSGAAATANAFVTAMTAQTTSALRRQLGFVASA